VVTWPVALTVIVTSAPATTAPYGSVAVPTMLPVLIVVCTHRATEDRRRSTNVGNEVRRMTTRPWQFEIRIIGLPFVVRRLWTSGAHSPRGHPLQDLLLVSASLSAVPCQSRFWNLLAHIRRNSVPLLKAPDTTKTCNRQLVRGMQAKTHFRGNCVGLLNLGAK
jgi:hypothetical protein